MGSIRTPVLLCCLIANFEAFRLLNLELFEALLLIKKLLIKKLGVLKLTNLPLDTQNIITQQFQF